MKNKKGVSLPKDLYEKIEARVKDTEFSSVDDYVSYVLTEVIRDLESKSTDSISETDQEKVKERLRALGYID